MDNKKKGLLIVDDDPDILELLCELFEELGYHIMTASCGTSALRILEVKAVSLIISDWNMPFMGGEELYYELRRRGTQVKFIFFTARPFIKNKGLSKEVPFFKKPHELLNLVAYVKKTFP